jgi:hypothetical protein
MTPPTYREIVLSFSHLTATVARMFDRGRANLTLTIECDEDQFERVRTFMKLDESMKMMGMEITWRPKQ